MSQSVSLANTFDLFSLACSNDSAISPEANFMREASWVARSSKESSEALFGTNSRAIERVWALFNECSAPDWDGYGADPLLLQTVYGAIELIRALPSEMPMPEFSVEPDGAIAMDWMKSRSTVFSLSISTDERIPYAWLDGAESGHGVGIFSNGVIPARIVEEIRRILSNGHASIRTA